MSKFEGVRIAKPHEVDQVYDLLLALHAENGMFTLAPDKARRTIVDMLDPRQGIVGVIDGPQGLEGSIGLYKTAWYYTEDPHLSEFWNFVRPDCRRSTHAKRLIEFAKWCSEQLGIPLHIGIVTTERAEAKQRLYRRQLQHVGGYYMWGAPPRLGDEIEKVAKRNTETDATLQEMRQAAEKLVKSDAKPSFRGGDRVKAASALEKLKRTVEKASV